MGHALWQPDLARAGFQLRHWSRARGRCSASRTGAPSAPDIVLLAVRDEAIPQAARYILETRRPDRQRPFALRRCAAPAEVFWAERARARRRHAASAALVRDRGRGGGAKTLAAWCLPSPAIRRDVMRLSSCAGPGASPCRSRPISRRPITPRLSWRRTTSRPCSMSPRTCWPTSACIARMPKRPWPRSPAPSSTTSRRVGLPAALTGPFARGDGATVARHLVGLAGISAEAEAVYRALGPSALDLAYRKGRPTTLTSIVSPRSSLPRPTGTALVPSLQRAQTKLPSPDAVECPPGHRGLRGPAAVPPPAARHRHRHRHR